MATEAIEKETMAAPSGRDTKGNDRIKVCVRVRPLSSAERKSVVGRIAWRWGAVGASEVQNAKDQSSPAAGEASRVGNEREKNTDPCFIEQIWYPPGQGNTRLRAQFFFDKLFGPKVRTKPIYSAVGADIVRACTLHGYHGAIFAYGQTSTGKTFTMQGSAEYPGLIPLAVNDVFQRLKSSPREFVLRVSYLEIYNETVNDLLRPSSVNLRIFDDPQRGVVIRGLEETLVVSPDQIFSLITAGESHRHVGSTNYNYRSSRSHTIFRMVIESRQSGSRGNGSALVSSLSLVDLAGSESASAATKRSKKRRAEGGYINKSLLTLSHIILKLSDTQNQSSSSSMSPSLHLPYRDSKLTRILKPALDGRSMMSIICTMTPSATNFGESLNTLKFASRAKRIVSHAIVNQVADETALIIKYQTEIARLRSQLSLAKQEAKRVQQQQQQRQSHLPPKPLVSREEALKNRELQNALKQAIENIGRVILNSKQRRQRQKRRSSGPYQTSTVSSRSKQRSTKPPSPSLRDKKSRRSRRSQGSVKLQKQGEAELVVHSSSSSRQATEAAIGESNRPTKQTAGDEQEQQRRSSSGKKNQIGFKLADIRVKTKDDKTGNSAESNHNESLGSVPNPSLIDDSSEVSMSDSLSSGESSSWSGESSLDRDSEEDDHPLENSRNLKSFTPRFFQRSRQLSDTALSLEKSGGAGNLRGRSFSHDSTSKMINTVDKRTSRATSPGLDLSPELARISKRIEHSQIDSSLLAGDHRGGGGSNRKARKDRASIQSELDGIRDHLTTLLQQVTRAEGQGVGIEEGDEEPEEGDEEPGDHEERGDPSEQQFDAPIVRMPSAHSTSSVDTIPDFRGRSSDSLGGLLSSSYYAVDANDGSPRSMDLKQQVLALQKKVEDQALKFSVSQADSSFLSEVLAQKDEILNECQALLMELDSRYQGLSERCTVLETTVRKKNERIRELEVLAGLRDDARSNVGAVSTTTVDKGVLIGDNSAAGDEGGLELRAMDGAHQSSNSVRKAGTGKGEDDRSALSTGKDESASTLLIKRRNSHRKLVKWVGNGTPVNHTGPGKVVFGSQEAQGDVGMSASAGNRNLEQSGSPAADLENDRLEDVPSYSKLMSRLSELQGQLRTSPLKTAANVATVGIRLKRRAKIAKERLRQERESKTLALQGKNFEPLGADGSDDDGVDYLSAEEGSAVILL